MQQADEGQRYDVVVVGASLSGVASAAILANHGLKVALVDQLETAVGKHGGTEFNGYWISWGHRDAINGIGDLISTPLLELYAKAGVRVEVRKGGFGEGVRIHRLPEESWVELSYNEMMGVGGQNEDAIESCRRKVQGFTVGLSSDQVEEAARELDRVLQRFASMSDEEAWSLIEMGMGEWLRRNVRNPTVRNVLISNMEAFQCSPGEDASVGKYVLYAVKRPPRNLYETGPVIDEETSGEQARISPLLRRFLQLGGKTFFGWKPVEILVDHPRGGSTCAVRGVVCRNKSNFVVQLDAPVVITDWFGWDLGKLLDETLLSPIFRDRAANVRRYTTDVVGWFAGLNRLPTIRFTGEIDQFAGWNRIQNGRGAVKEYHGGWCFHSLQYERCAPPGKHLLGISIGHQDRFKTWPEAKAEIDVSLEYLRKFYRDLDECVEWSHYHWVEAPQVHAWAFKPVLGHPVKVSTIEGLYCASASAEVQSRSREGMGIFSAAEGAAALEAVELITQEYGHLFTGRSG